jgi:hypothetical protein
MAFFSRFFAPQERAPLPTLEEILQSRGIPADLPGLAPHAEEFQHLNAGERNRWGDAIQALQSKGEPLPPVWLDAQYDLFPRLVPSWAAERDGTCARPHFEGLSLAVQTAGQLMPEPWLTLWDVTWEDVVDRAMDQLRERSQGKPMVRLPSGIYRGAYDDGQAASRMLRPEVWAGLFPGQNTFIAVPAEDEFFVAPQVLLPQMVEAVSKVLASTESRLMGTIFQEVGGKLLPANLQDPHPIAQPQRELRQSDQAEAYRAQEAHLPAEQGVAAAPGLIRVQQGRSVSYTTWQEGRPVFLPDTDLIGFLSADGRPLGIYFRQTLPRIPELRGTLVDIWGPRRIRFEGFPTAAQLDRLERFATPEQMAELFKLPSPGAAKPRISPQATERVGRPLQGTSPVPAHLRGISLGVQDED